MERNASTHYCLLIGLALLIAACSHPHPKPSIKDEVVADIAKNTTAADDNVQPTNTPHVDNTFNDLEDNEPFIWQRIAKKLALSDFYDHPRVIQQKRYYLSRADLLSRVTRRSEPFIHFILSEIERRQMPAELAILPIVESGYVPKARSRAKAVGLWQFMSYTAKEFGLQKTHGYDGRYDVYASTVAALRYLEQLHSEFNGDWLLALAAYNAGPQRIKRALKTSTKNKNGNAYWDLQLSRESREYVPKILALGSIVRDYKLHRSMLHAIENEPYLTAIKVNKSISPAKLVQKSGINAAELRLLNPALRHMNYPVPKDYHLLAPKNDAELLTMAIRSLPEEPMPAWLQHKITWGESLSVIAKQYGTSVATLRETNNLKSNTIVAGYTLLIQPFRNSGNKSASRQAPPKSPPTGQKDPPYFYVVVNGDSFWKIAHRNNTTVDRLVNSNDRNPNQVLYPGEFILID